MPSLAALLLLFFASDDLAPPPSAHLLHTAEGRGVQIYRCDAAPPSTFTWTLLAPEATLFDTATNRQVGTHGAGPVWTWSDGSAIHGTVLKRSPSPAAAGVPWLLLETRPVGNSAGALATVTFVQRLETRGGIAPSTGCDAAHQNVTVRVPYRATYNFFAPSPKP